MSRAKRLTRFGQISIGDAITLESAYGLKACIVDDVLNAGTESEEIILDSIANIYFITDLYLTGKSWARNVEFRKPKS